MAQCLISNSKKVFKRIAFIGIVYNCAAIAICVLSCLN